MRAREGCPEPECGRRPCLRTGLPLQEQALPVLALQRLDPLRDPPPSRSVLTGLPTPTQRPPLKTYGAILFVFCLSRPGKYQFNRLFPLTECQIQESRSDSRAFEILSSEKSFAVLAENSVERTVWVKAINDAKRAHLDSLGIAHGKEEVRSPLVLDLPPSSSLSAEYVMGWTYTISIT